MRKKDCGIYCIENIFNNKKYIGLSRDIKRRWNEHKSELKSNTHNNKYLQSAWDKYGESAFRFYVVELCSEDCLSEKECYYIKLYKTLSHENGYNLTTGGENTSVGRMVISLKDNVIYNSVVEAANKESVTAITMIDWCRKRRNYTYLDEFNLLSEEEKEYWKNFNWDKLIHKKLSLAHSKKNLSKETLIKYSNAVSGKNNPMAYKVYCPQLDEYFDYVKCASEKYNICYSSISQCVNGKLKSAGKHPITGEKLTWIKI